MKSLLKTSRFAVIPLAVASVATALPLTLSGDAAGITGASVMLASVSDSVATQVADFARQMSDSSVTQVDWFIDHAPNLQVQADLQPVGVLYSANEGIFHAVHFDLTQINLPPPAVAS